MVTSADELIVGAIDLHCIIDEMLRCDVPARAVDTMACKNPARLLGLA